MCGSATSTFLSLWLQRETIEAFSKSPNQIKTIQKFESGTNNSQEKLNDFLTHCLLLSFASEKDCNDFLAHPAHTASTTLLPDMLDKVTVVDYWVQL